MSNSVVIFEKSNWDPADTVAFDGKGTLRIIYDTVTRSVTFATEYKGNWCSVEFPISVVPEIQLAVAQAQVAYG